MSRRKRGPKIVVRAKQSYPTARRARRSLFDAGYYPHMFSRACHTGTHWRWELKS